MLPMSEERVRTRVRTAEGWRDLQQYLVAEHAQAAVEGVQVEGIDEAEPTPEVLEAIATAEAIVIGPSNPVISIGPIISMPAVREAITASAAPGRGREPLRGRAGRQGADRPLHARAGPALDRRGGRVALRGPDRRHALRPGGSRSAARGHQGDELPDADGGSAGQAASWPSEPSSSPRRLLGRHESPRNWGMNVALTVSLTIRGVRVRQLAHDRDRSGEGALGRQRATGRPALRRRAQPLAEALFLDLILKLPRSRCIDDVLIVTADASIARQARWFGCQGPRPGGGRGALGGRRRRGPCRTGRGRRAGRDVARRLPDARHR